jgi:hypothetical protein
MKKTLVGIGCTLCIYSLPAHAYIGPGVGVTMIGWFVGFIVTMGAALSALIVWPLRMLFKKQKGPTDKHPENIPPENTDLDKQQMQE